MIRTLSLVDRADATTLLELKRLVQTAYEDGAPDSAQVVVVAGTASVPGITHHVRVAWEAAQ